MFLSGTLTPAMSGKSFTRTIKELSPVLFGPATGPERVVYEVRRGEVDKNTKIRYDTTTIFPGLLGRELPKTFGHYHKGVDFPELYVVLEGRAWYLIQRPQKANPKIIEEVYLIEAKENEKTIIPPGFGHVSINPENKKLILGNWIGTGFEYDYQTYENLRGACYYLLESKGRQSVNLEKNSYYEKMPELAKVRPREFPKELENLEFLTKPEKYLEILTIENCFKRM